MSRKILVNLLRKISMYAYSKGININSQCFALARKIQRDEMIIFPDYDID
jgi:hypothetical protein